MYPADHIVVLFLLSFAVPHSRSLIALQDRRPALIRRQFTRQGPSSAAAPRRSDLVVLVIMSFPLLDWRTIIVPSGIGAVEVFHLERSTGIEAGVLKMG